MAKYRVWLEDKSLAYIEIEASNPTDARRKAENLIDENALFDANPPQFEQSLWHVHSIEPVA